MGWRGFVGAGLILALGGCGRISQTVILNRCERDIRDATDAIAAAGDDGQRAKGFSKRGAAYSEKARYSRAFKLIGEDEYERLFEVAMKDHGQAIALSPGSAELYLKRGEAYYNRGTVDAHPKEWFARAAVDFETAVQKDPGNYVGFGWLGLAHQQSGDPEKAVDDFTKEMALNPLGKARLTDAYCTVGSYHAGQKKYDAAAADFRKSIEMGGGGDGCGCDPYEPLMVLYTVETRQYDEAWELVHRAQRSKKWISPELIERLKKDSGRRE